MAAIKVGGMAKRLDELLRNARMLAENKVFDFRKFTTEELKELIDDNTSDERVREILELHGMYE